MSDFVLKNNYFELNGQIKQQISGTAIDTKFSPPYACLFMDKIEIAFLETQEFETRSFWCGFDILTIFFLSGHMVSKKWIKLRFPISKEEVTAKLRRVYL